MTVPLGSGTNGTVMCKSLARHQLNVACFFDRSGSAGRVRMLGLWRHRRAANAVILDEFYGQGTLFIVTYCLAFSQLCSSMLLLACIGFSVWSSVNSFWGGV